MAGQNIALNKTTPSYPAKPADVQAAPQVVVQWDPTFATAKSLTFALTVTDSLGVTSNEATVVVNIQQKPVAVVAGPNVITAGSTITLDGSKSTPPPGTGVTYKWTLIG